MSDPFAFTRRAIPSRAADLGFALELPADWLVHDLPPTDDDFSDPTLFLPLLLSTPTHSPIVVAVGARPAYDDGTVFDWAHYHLSNGKMAVQAMGPGQIGPHMAVVGEATQEADIGPVHVRYAFVEDGGRLVNLTLTAPAQLADAMGPVWNAVVRSFALDTARGQTVALHPDLPLPARAAPEPEPAAVEAPTFMHFALDDSAATLDPEHPINANLRERGIGFTPRLIATRDAERRATVGSGAIMATFDMPYGWHAIDDGRRALILDPTNAIQINLDRLRRDGRGDDEVLDAIAEQTAQDYEAPEFLRFDSDGISALGVRNIMVDGEAIEQAHMLVPAREPAYVLRARVTASPDRMVDACNLAELVLRSVGFLAEEYAEVPEQPEPESEVPNARDDGQPEWWHAAKAHELAGRLTDAEQTIRSAVPHIGALSSIARLYEERLDRLASEGDEAGAKAAFDDACSWITFYASAATSGGEGAALSLERDAFIEALGARYPRFVR